MATIDLRQFKPFVGNPQASDLFLIQRANAYEPLRITYTQMLAILGGGGGGTYLQEGTNVTITGTGTLVDPYIINASGGGGGGTVTPSSTDTFTNKSISGADNTLTNIPQSAVINLVSDLSTITTNISTNTSNIATNTTAIAGKISASSTDTLTNKTISGATNTILVPFSVLTSNQASYTLTATGYRQDYVVSNNQATVSLAIAGLTDNFKTETNIEYDVTVANPVITFPANSTLKIDGVEIVGTSATLTSSTTGKYLITIISKQISGSASHLVFATRMKA